MKFTHTIAFLAVAIFASFATADENYDIIEKVMNKGMKGKEGPMAQLLGGTLNEKKTTKLHELVATMEGTEAPIGDQEAYDKKVNELIASLAAVAEGDKSEDAIARLKKAQNCKACHSDHKPD